MDALHVPQDLLIGGGHVEPLGVVHVVQFRLVERPHHIRVDHRRQGVLRIGDRVPDRDQLRGKAIGRPPERAARMSLLPEKYR